MRLSKDDLTLIAIALRDMKSASEAGLVRAAETMDLESIRDHSTRLATVETTLNKIETKLFPNQSETPVETPVDQVETTSSEALHRVA